MKIPKKKKKRRRCPLFKICGPAVVRQRLGENWHQRFCFSNFEECCHFEGMKKIAERVNKEKNNQTN
jgi:hypothetical protein